MSRTDSIVRRLVLYILNTGMLVWYVDALGGAAGCNSCVWVCSVVTGATLITVHGWQDLGYSNLC
jgi:hypothetical protein